MAVSFDDDRHYEMEALISDTIESLDGASSMLAILNEDALPPDMHARLHALCDVLVMCRTRLETAASMLDA